MGPKKSSSDWSNESGYPGVFYKLCKEEDILIIPHCVTHLVGRQVEHVSPKKSKDSKVSDKFGSFSIYTNESKVEDLLICGSLRPPQMGIVYENPDDKDSPVAVICKSFYIEYALINVIGKSLKSYPTINCLKIENCCISPEIAEALALLLADDSGKWISDLSLDGNENISHVLPMFIKLPSSVKYLSLERCSLDDEAIKLIAEPLGFTDEKDHKLVLLNLSMNKIGNKGASYLAKALRTNRTLVSLSLAGNQIGDEGAGYLTEVLQKFQLTFEEVVLRRKRIFDLIFKKKNAVEKYIEEWKMKGGLENQALKMNTKSAERIGRRIRGPDGKIRCLSSRDRKNKPGTAKVNSGEKFRGRLRVGTEEGSGGVEPNLSEIMALVQQVESEMPPDKHPFVNEALPAEDALWCMGCWSLANLNLAYNYLSAESVEKFTEVFYSQNENLLTKAGLSRLVLLPGNLFQEPCLEFQKLQTAIIYRNSKKEMSNSMEVAPGGSLSSARRTTLSRRTSKTFN